LVKINVTVSIERELRERARKLGLNLSQLLEFAIREVSEHGRITSEDFQLAMLEERLSHYEELIEKAKHELRSLELRRDEIKRQIEGLRTEIRERERSERLAILFKMLNARIAEANFDVDEAWESSQDIIAQLHANGFEMDKERFEKHVERLKLFSI